MRRKCAVIKVALFDLGNVLIDFDYSLAVKRILLHCDKSQEKVYEFFFNSPLPCLFEEGKVPPEDFFSSVKESLGLNLDYKDFLPVWNEIFTFNRKNQAVYELCKRLKANFRIAILSNTNTLHYDYLKTAFPIWNIFDQVFLSFKLGLKKPDPLIYKKVLEVLDVPAQAVFYVDDKAEFISEARTLGIRGVVFSGIEQLEKDLIFAGVLNMRTDNPPKNVLCPYVK